MSLSLSVSDSISIRASSSSDSRLFDKHFRAACSAFRSRFRISSSIIRAVFSLWSHPSVSFYPEMGGAFRKNRRLNPAHRSFPGCRPFAAPSGRLFGGHCRFRLDVVESQLFGNAQGLTKRHDSHLFDRVGAGKQHGNQGSRPTSRIINRERCFDSATMVTFDFSRRDVRSASPNSECFIESRLV